MPQPYSLDLRERVVRFVSSGRSRRAAAAHFEVSVSFVVKLVKAYDVRGDLAPQAKRRSTPFQARTASRVSAGSCDGEERHHHAGIGGRTRGCAHHKGRSRFDLAVADPPWLSLQKKLCRPANKIVPTLDRLATNGWPSGSRRCALSRTDWSSWMRPAPTPR